jgi:hypothetical protein
VDRPGAFETGAAGSAVERVGRRIKLYRRPHLKVIADLDRRAVEEHTVVVDRAARPDPDVVAVIAGEARLDVDALASHSEQLPALGDQFRVERVVKLAVQHFLLLANRHHRFSIVTISPFFGRSVVHAVG